MPFNEPHFAGHNMLNPPAIVRQAEVFDEQALKREWLDACADEQDAVSRKQAVLRKALARWPKVQGGLHGKQMVYNPEMRRFVRDVLGMPDESRGRINNYAYRLLKEGGREAQNKRGSAAYGRTKRIKNAVAELVTLYRLGKVDAHTFAEKLSRFYEEQTNVTQA